MSKKRIGILTSGGDCPGLNAVIRGAVKASHQMGYDCVGFLKGYEGLYDPVQYVHLTPNSTRGILNQGGTILGSTNKGRFAATVGVDDRQELDPELIEGVKGTIEQLGIDGLICVGGDGSLAVSQQFHEQGIKVVGVPKTIDNDLSATAFTFGFDSAIECATDALDRLHTTGSSHERIMVLEVMGRHAGWIALHAGIAGGGDVILIPEISWDYENLCHKILHRESQGKKFTLVVVAEGAELPGGDLVGEQRNGQQMKLGGVGRAVAEEIERRLHRETRLSVLGHLQRGGKPTTFDRVLATQFGAHAVRLVHEGRFGEMICSRPPEMTSVPIMEAVNELRRVDPHGPAVQAARALGISFGDRAADEVGENVFDRLEPVAHIADLVADESELMETPTEAASAVEETVESPAEKTARPDQLATRAEDSDDVAEAEELNRQRELADRPAVEAQAQVEPAAAAAGWDAPADVSDKVAEAEGPNCQRELADDPTNDSPAQSEPTIAAEGFNATADTSSEDEEVEAVAETMLDLVADADEAIHGQVAADELIAAERSVAEPAEEPTEAAPEAEEAPEDEKPETDAIEDEIEEQLAASDPVVEEATEATPLEAEEPVAETAAAPASPDFSEAESQLAARIAGAVHVTQDAAAVETADAESAETPAPAALDSAAESLADRVRKTLAAAHAKEAALDDPIEEPHGDDLVAEARSALEEALAD